MSRLLVEIEDGFWVNPADVTCVQGSEDGTSSTIYLRGKDATEWEVAVRANRVAEIINGYAQ